MDRDDLLDVLADLTHDLGKHLPRPVRWLPPEADEAAVRAALTAALAAPAGGESAAALWAEGVEALAPLAHTPAVQALHAVMARALGWQARLDGPLDRAAIEADLLAVAPALRAVMDGIEA